MAPMYQPHNGLPRDLSLTCDAPMFENGIFNPGNESQSARSSYWTLKHPSALPILETSDLAPPWPTGNLTFDR